MSNPVTLQLQTLRSALDQQIIQLHTTLGFSNQCLEAAFYSLQGNAKRIRPLLCLLLAQELGAKTLPFLSAIAIEYFHTASLIADDLPCMDNDEQRRGRPAAHIQYGEATALLASYGLISAGFDLIIRESERIRQSDEPFKEAWADILCLATKSAHHYTGFNGLVSGQFYDLNSLHPTKKELERIIDLKTSCLFKLSFIFGWIFGGGDLKRIEEVKTCATHFGLLFQIADDIDDLDQDKEREEQINIAALVGRNEALQIVEEEKAAFKNTLQSLGLRSENLLSLPDFILSRITCKRV